MSIDRPGLTVFVAGNPAPKGSNDQRLRDEDE